MLPTRTSFSAFEDRSPLYEDVRSLLSPGFLSTSVNFNGVQVSLRSLNSDDLFLIDARSGQEAEEWYDWLLATSIWLMDGQILERNQEVVVWLFKKLQELPLEFKSSLSTASMILTKRFFRARGRSLSYFYERESRDLWGGRGSKLFENTFAWVGRNSVQDLWVYYNKMEDMRLHRIFDQNMASFSASPHAPKSIKKINDKMKSDEMMLETDRQIAQDKMYFESFGIEFEDNRYIRQGYGQVQVAMTFEELEEQYQNYLDGKKDLHDLRVDETRRIMMAEKQAKKDQKEQRKQKALKIRQEMIPDQTGPRVLVGTEAQQYIQKMNEEMRQPNVGFVYEEDGNAPLYQRHIEQEIAPPPKKSRVLSQKEQEELLSMSGNPNEGRDLSEELNSYRPKGGR